jgi:hypothetical protein
MQLQQYRATEICSVHREIACNGAYVTLPAVSQPNDLLPFSLTPEHPSHTLVMSVILCGVILSRSLRFGEDVRDMYYITSVRFIAVPA